MPNKIDNIEIRSEEVQEILSAVPNWMIRLGNTLILGLIILFLILSWVIKYPDVIVAQAALTTENPPQKEYAKNSGKLQHLLVKNEEIVFPNSDLAVLENTAVYNDVQFLKQILDTIAITKNNFQFPMDQMPLLFLGEINVAYALFENNYSSYYINKKEQPFKTKIASHKNSASELQIRLQTLVSQKVIQQNELKFQRKDVNRYQQLFSKGVVSEQEYEIKQLQLLKAERNYKTVTSAISQLKETIGNTDNSFSLNTTTNSSSEIQLLKHTIQSFNQLKRAIYDWEYKYVLQSDIKGKVSFLNFWSINQHVNSGDQLFTIIPEKNNSFVAKLKVPVLNSGKIEIGQLVNLRLNNYPEMEYGVLKGKVTHISEITTKEGHYIVDVSLPKKLETSYHKVLDFKHEMSGSAEIITKDLRLIERFLGQLRNVLN